MTKEELRSAIVARRPEWKGRVWITKYCVGIRGIGSYWPKPETEEDIEGWIEEWWLDGWIHGGMA